MCGICGILAKKNTGVDNSVIKKMCSNYRAKPDDWIWSNTNLSEVAMGTIELLRNQSNRQALAMKQATYVRSHHTVESMARSYDALYQAAIERTCLGCSKCYRK